MTGQELRRVILEKWGCSYDVQLRRLPDRVLVQIMWRYQEQASFPLSEFEFLQHLSQIVAHLNDWGAIAQVTEFIRTTKQRPRLGKAVCIPVKLGGRSLEWMVDVK